MQTQTAPAPETDFAPGEPLRFLPMRDVLARTGFSVSTLDRYVAEGSFPCPARPRPGLRMWVEGDITNWQLAVIAGQPPGAGHYTRPGQSREGKL